MNTWAYVTSAIVIWMVSGLLAAFWLARRGHRDPYWLFVGPVLGLAFIPIAWERAERLPKRLARIEAERRGSGALRVLVALDGSEEAHRAFEDAVRMLGSQVGSYILAEVVDYDTGEAGALGVDAAESRLLDAAATVPGELTSCEVLTGPPVQTLLKFADEEQVDAIVAGKRGHGMSERLLGSVAESLVRQSSVPVLVGSTSDVGSAGSGRRSLRHPVRH